MSGQTPGRERPEQSAKDRTPKKDRPVSPAQQTRVPVSVTVVELTGDVLDNPADKTVVLNAGPGTSDPSASTTAMVPDPVLVSTTTATAVADLATPFLNAPAPPVSQARASLAVDNATTQRRFFIKEPKGDLVENKELVGASPSFDYPMYYYREDQLKPATGDVDTARESGEIQNQLQKNILSERKLLQHFGDIAGDKPVCVWMSDTLTWDLNLPVRTPLPFLPGFLQAFVICVGLPPFLVSLYGKGDNSAAVEDYGSDTARLLHWSLLDFCHLNFSVLPMNAELDAFLERKVDLKTEIKKSMKVVKRYTKSPLRLNKDTFARLKAATTALMGATFVPCLLKNEPRDTMWLLLMSKEWRNVVSHVIEMLHREKRYEMTYSPTMPTSAKVVVALEAAKRVSFTREIRVTCMTDEVQICLQRLEQQVQDDLDISLRLTCRRVGSSEEQSEATILLEDTTERQLQEMYGLISDGRLSELCQHPSLGHHAFLDDLQVFCSRQKHEQQFLLRALDKEHGLPLLYWSLWSHSTHLTQWCLTKMKELVDSGGVLSESLLSAALATIFIAASDDSLTVNAKEFVKIITCMQFQHGAKDTLKLALPYPEPFETEKGKIRYTEIKTCLQSPGVCYLNDPSLPIPATLLSVTSTEDAVSVELPGRHWYLVLRLLADREVDETDDDDNTVLHIAADTGDLQAITLAVKSGASLVVKNNEGLTPCQLAQRRWTKPEETCTIKDDHIPSRDLQAACRDGDIKKVTTALCQNASVQHKEGQNGNTPLHTACEHGHRKIASLLILLGAEIDTENKAGFTPLCLACDSGHKRTAEVLIMCGSKNDTKNTSGLTPLHSACTRGHTDTARLLIEHHADINAKSYAGFTPLHLACESGHVDTVALLIEHDAGIDTKTKDGFTPLHLSCKSGLPETTELLIKCGAEIDTKTDTGLTPLHFACGSGLTETAKLLIECDAEIDTVLNFYSLGLIKVLTQNVTKTDSAEEEGNAHGGCAETAKLLIERSAEIFSNTRASRMLLHRACQSGMLGTVQMLLEHGAGVNFADSDGYTPLHYASRSGHLDVCRELIKHHAKMNSRTSRGLSALHLACENSHVDVVELLLKQGADVSSKDDCNRTTLHMACSVGRIDIVGLLCKYAYNAAVTQKQGNGSTTLHKACSCGTADIVNAPDNMGYTPLQLAYSLYRTDMVCIQRALLVASCEL